LPGFAARDGIIGPVSIAPRKTVCALCGGIFVMVGPPLPLDVTALCPNGLRLPPPPEEPQRR
jgi:hypothetical protein